MLGPGAIVLVGRARQKPALVQVCNWEDRRGIWVGLELAGDKPDPEAVRCFRGQDVQGLFVDGKIEPVFPDLIP